MRMLMIAIHYGRNGSIRGFRLFNLNTNEWIDTTYESVYESIKKGIEITNVEIDSAGNLSGTNGSFDRYPKIDYTGKLSGKSPLIIIMKLLDGGFTVTNYMGEVVNISEAEAINYASTEGIANGKITKNIISSIFGEYDQEKAIDKEKQATKLKMKLDLVGEDKFTITQDNAIKCNDYDIEECIIPKGVTSIATRAFYNCGKLKVIKLPDSIREIGIGAFINCESLTDINIPEGIEYINNRTFLNCTSLTSIILPNSMKKIEHDAFKGCSKLRKVSTGPSTIIEYGAIPRGVKIVKRNK